jgi:hypothetical protein
MWHRKIDGPEDVFGWSVLAGGSRVHRPPAGQPTDLVHIFRAYADLSDEQGHFLQNDLYVGYRLNPPTL